MHLNSGAGNTILSRRTGRWHSLEVPEFLTEPLPGTRNQQDVNDALRGVVGGNYDDDYDNAIQSLTQK